MTANGVISSTWWTVKSIYVTIKWLSKGNVLYILWRAHWEIASAVQAVYHWDTAAWLHHICLRSLMFTTNMRFTAGKIHKIIWANAISPGSVISSNEALLHGFSGSTPVASHCQYSLIASSNSPAFLIKIDNPCSEGYHCQQDIVAEHLFYQNLSLSTADLERVFWLPCFE